MSLPRPLLAIAAAFSVFPLWSLSFSNPLSVYLRSGSMWAAVIGVLAYWIMPTLIVIATLRRSIVLLPLFMLECGLLLIQSFTTVGASSPFLQTTRHVVLGIACAFGFVLMSREMIFPLLQGGGRSWRSHPRIYANRPAMITQIASESTRIKAVLENASLSGMLLSVPTAQVETLLARSRQGLKITIDVPLGTTTEQVQAELVWYEAIGPATRIGLRSASEPALAAVLRRAAAATQVSAEGLPVAGRIRARAATLGSSFDRLWARTSVRTATFALWGAAIIGTIWIPSCGQIDAVGLAAVTDAPEAGTTEVILDLTREAEAAELGLVSDPYRLVIAIEGCASGHTVRIEWVEGVGALLPLLIGDSRCTARVVEVKRGAEVFLPQTNPFNSSLNGANVYRSGSGHEIKLVNTEVLPVTIVNAVSLRYAIAEVTIAQSQPTVLKVTPPSKACEIIVIGDPMARDVKFEVRIHPVYLPYISQLTFFPCGLASQWKDCRPAAMSNPKFISYKNAFNKRLRGAAPYAVAAVVDINNPELRRQVEADGKVLHCDEVYYAPR